MKRSMSLLFVAALIPLSACSDLQQPVAPDLALQGITAVDPVTVMSRNIYLGANIDALIDPSVPLEEALVQALTELERTSFPTRAPKLAMEIAQRLPHVIGLQEVSRYDFITAAGSQSMDFLAILQAYLGAMGAHYDVAVHQENVSLTLPGIGPLLGITYTDGDAILVRSDVAWDDADAGHFDSQVTLEVMGHEFQNLRGWNAVSVEIEGRWYRFVNTHFEIQAFRPYQEGQARELVQMLKDETLPILMVGDFNSAANPDAPLASRTDSYHILRTAGFADLWLREPHSRGGLTCCQASDLSNATSQLNQRLDIVFVRNGRAGFGGRSSVEVFGLEPFTIGTDELLWPSDHAGVFAKIWFAPGQLKK
jgi:endonuclease/exonuclease/phosphatase family metal-dependent hydrolase